MPSIQLGPFELHAPIGQGGMAEVWRGEHRGQGVPVATKIMTGPKAVLREYLEAFRNEVQAVAGLDHPNIVMVFDHGEVDAAAEEQAGGRIKAGSPYLVMEYASGGSLDLLEKPLSWRNLKAILLVLLDALAHAHARGVIHRDMKPANVLLCGPDDVRPGLKLTDFGIAHAVGEQSRRGSVEISMGTPYYMAPEQFEGAFRDYGPWTDLYALGCMAYEFAVGTVPYDGDNLVRLAYQHLRQPTPKVVARDVPSGFEAWIHRMMAKLPEDRFRRAADAAWALAQLGGPADDDAWEPEDLELESLGMRMSRPVVSFRDTQVMLIRTGHHFGWNTHPSEARTGNRGLARPMRVASDDYLDAVHSPLDSGAVAKVEKRPISLADRELPPLPLSWRRPGVSGQSMKLVGAGLGLYGLRSIPLVDRHEERNLIWEALSECRESGSARLVLLRGAAGVGKSRVVEWMCQRAHEVGSATVLQAFHSPDGGPADGLPRMIARFMRCVGLGRGEMLERAQKVMRELGATDAWDWNAVTELMAPASERDLLEGALRVRFGSPAERHAVVRRLFGRLTRERPVICWIDDAQWGLDTLGLVENVVRQQAIEPMPVLFLLTVRDEALAMQPQAEERLEAIMNLPDTAETGIGPLDQSDRTALVQELLGLEGELARQVEERTGGNPLFAVQLVGDWVHRGVLEVGERGFVLRAGEQAVLPDDLYQVWKGRIDRLLETQPASAGQALEIAAVLGREVNPDEWAAACEEAGVHLPDGLSRALFNQRLAVRTAGGWTFAHGILRETLERQAREGERWQEHHRACAEMLRMEYMPDTRGLSERIGRHRLEAAEYAVAIDLLLLAAKERREASEYREAHELLTLRDEALERCGASEGDDRWGQGWVLRSWVCSNQGAVQQAWAWSARAELSARTYGWAPLLPQALLGMSVASRDMGDLTRAWTLTEEARTAYELNEDRLGIAHCIQGLGVIARSSGHLALARDLIMGALEQHDLIENPFGVSQCKQRLTEVILRQGDLQRALHMATEALEDARRLGERLGEANSLNLMGDVRRFGGDLQGARDHYEAALHIYELLGSTSVLQAQKNLAMVELAQGHYEQAEERLAPIADRLEKEELLGDAATVRVALLPCAAAQRDVRRWDELCARLEAFHRAGHIVDHDVAECAEWAGHLAASAGWSRRASFAYELALRQWEVLGRQDRVAAVSEQHRIHADG